MKPVSFLRNAWRKLEGKSSADSRPPPPSQPPPAPKIKVSQTVRSGSPIACVDGRWHRPPFERRKTLRHTPSERQISSPIVLYHSPKGSQSSTHLEHRTKPPVLPSYKPLPPLDLYGNVPQPYATSNGPRRSSDSSQRCRIGSVSSYSRPQRPPAATVQAVLDPPIRLSYSTPHLLSSGRSDVSTDGSEAEPFPLSLFPPPPPLKVPRKIPAPLVLKTGSRAPSVSSRDSTPVGTPTTPRFFASSSNVSTPSPTKKVSFTRSTGPYSPPPSDPPNTPLPDVPTKEKRLPSLRSTRSSSNFRPDAQPVPFPAMHRTTASEPIADQPALRSGKTRVYVDKRPSEPPVQWGYAL